MNNARSNFIACSKARRAKGGGKARGRLIRIDENLLIVYVQSVGTPLRGKTHIFMGQVRGPRVVTFLGACEQNRGTRDTSSSLVLLAALLAPLELIIVISFQGRVTERRLAMEHSGKTANYRQGRSRSSEKADSRRDEPTKTTAAYLTFKYLTAITSGLAEPEKMG